VVNRTTWLEELEESVSRYEREVADATRAVDAVQTRLKTAQKHLEVAQNFLEIERQRFASECPVERMTPKEACALAVQEKGRATIKEIIQWLEKRGVTFDTKFPGRTVHAALLHASGIKKVAPGTYEAI